MLIRSIRAENFMKFHRLSIEDLPSRGLIGIEGQNEGGKSTIGELVQFALFGKSLSTLESSILEVINWERDQCAVELEIEVPSEANRGVYRIWREIDRYGTNFARLTRETDDGWSEVASGLMQVQARLAELLRFDFDDFTRSFFLAEREFPRSPEAMREFLDRMVGAEVLVEVAESVRREIKEFEVEFAKQQSEIKRNQQQIEKYLPNIEKIPEIDAQRKEHTTRLEELKETDRRLGSNDAEIEKTIRAREAQRDRMRSLPQKPTSRLKDGVQHLLEGYPSKPDGVLESSAKDISKIRSRLHEFEKLADRFDRVVRCHEESLKRTEQVLDGTAEDSLARRRDACGVRVLQARRARGRSVLGGTALFLTGLGLVAVGIALAQEGLVPPEAWQLTAASTALAALGVGGVFAVIGIVLWTRAAGQRRTIEACSREETALDAESTAETKKLEILEQFGRDSARMDEVTPGFDGVDDESLRGAVAEYQEQLVKVTGGVPLEKGCAGLAEDENRLIQRLRAAAKNSKKERQKCGELQTKELSRRERCETEIREYEKQAGRKAGLEEQIREFKVGSDSVRNEIETRQLLLQLLDETVESVRRRAGPSVGKTMRKLLPALTGGRYRDLKITPDFKLQVFTSEKSDFLSQHELSGGTFEGRSLGFRLAFSQAFIRAVVRGPQFLFLDEPFKAMDTDRVHRTLAALVRLSPELQQIFVVIPGIRDADRTLFEVIHRVTVGEVKLGDSGLSAQAHPSTLLAARPDVSVAPPLVMVGMDSDDTERDAQRRSLESDESSLLDELEELTAKHVDSDSGLPAGSGGDSDGVFAAPPPEPEEGER